MATKWMSQILSASRRIRCFHGSAGLQDKLDPNLEPITALSLLKKWGETNRKEFVGLNHLSMNHGAKGLSACMSIDVPFCAMVRHPIVTNDSQFQERNATESLHPLKRERYVRMIGQIPEIKAIVDISKREDIIFFRCAESVIFHLLGIEVNGCETFKFENYTKDYSEIQRLLGFITREQMQEDHNIAIAFETLGKTNVHRKQSLGVEETWHEVWSPKQRQIFALLWRHILAEHSRVVVNYPDVEELFQNAGV